MNDQRTTPREARQSHTGTLLAMISSRFTIPTEEDMRHDFVCHICEEPYLSTDNPEMAVKLTCGHVVGATCLLKWLAPLSGQRKNSCPFCRRPLLLKLVPPYAGLPGRSRLPNAIIEQNINCSNASKCAIYLVKHFVYAVFCRALLEVVARILAVITVLACYKPFISPDDLHACFEGMSTISEALLFAQKVMSLLLLIGKPILEITGII
ncbi:hypothetical protein N7G274_009578 [Stereocaulon virgatum]|uniref:RING-type domain-containing protein n=1 Tax=Stereocaulon virgatum TaxID=373712 RepID=A0ABR3ZWE6_9LECA